MEETILSSAGVTDEVRTSAPDAVADNAEATEPAPSAKKPARDRKKPPKPMAAAPPGDLERLQIENDELRRQVATLSRSDRVLAEASEGEARWFSCRLGQLPLHMATPILARSPREAVRSYCQRMGVVWNKDLDEPRTADRIHCEEMAAPQASQMRGKYTRIELVALGFSEQELDASGI